MRQITYRVLGLALATLVTTLAVPASSAQIDPAISGLPVADNPAGDEIVRVIQNGSTKAAPIGALFSSLSNSSGNPTPYNGAVLPKWRKALNVLRAGGTDNVRVAFVGDSKTRFFPLAGGATKSKTRRLGELLALAGVPMITDTIFGTGGATSMADAVAYDPRLSGFSGWSGGNVSLGGSAFYSGGTTPGSFTPTKAINRASILYASSGGSGTFSVTKGSETFSFATAGTTALGRAEVTFATKDTSPITIARTGAGNLNIVGIVAWDSAQSGVEIGNFGVVGVSSAYQADTTNGYSPANALATYAPALTVINLGTNDLNLGSATLPTFLANMAVIIDKAQLSGDAIVTWPAIAGTGSAAGANATRSIWKGALRSLAASKGALFLDEEALFGGRAGAQAGGWFSDDLHEAAPAAFAEANALARVLLGS